MNLRGAMSNLLAAWSCIHQRRPIDLRGTIVRQASRRRKCGRKAVCERSPRTCGTIAGRQRESRVCKQNQKAELLFCHIGGWKRDVGRELILVLARSDFLVSVYSCYNDPVSRDGHFVKSETDEDAFLLSIHRERFPKP